MGIHICGAPCCWGVDDINNPHLPTWQRVLREAHEAGYSAIELGPNGWIPTDDIEGVTEELNKNQLSIVAGTIFDDVLSDDNYEKLLHQVDGICQLITKLPPLPREDGQRWPTPYMTVMDWGHDERDYEAGHSDRAPRLDEAGWGKLVSHFKGLCERANSYGVRPVLHPHCGGYIAFGDEIDLLAEEIPNDLAGFVLDTGHLQYAGMDPVAWLRKYKDRLVTLAKEKGLLLGCAPDTFLGGRLQTIRELIDSGKLGRITGGGAYFIGHGHEFHHPAPAFFYQPGAGPLYDMGPYYMTALLSLLGPVRRVCAMATKAADTRTVPSGPSKGQVLPVDVDTHINAILEFACGSIVTLTCSFDVWDSEMPRMELYGTEGTVLIDEKDPISGPNLFGGDTLLRTPAEYRWATPDRNPAHVNTPWTVVPNHHPFNSVSHAENPRGIGLVDMVYALAQHRTPRASGDMALHSLEVMECILKSAHEHIFCEPETTFERPAPLPLDFPASEAAN